MRGMRNVNLSMIKNAIRIVAVLSVLALCAPMPALARVASGVWFEKLPKGVTFDVAPAMSKDQARLAAFGEAVFAEALDLVKGGLSEERKVFLHDFLVPKASHYVVSYTELSVEATPEGKSISVDVEINRESLRQELKQLGLFATIAAPLAYNPQYGTVQPDTWQLLGRLHILYGLTPSTEAPLELKMEYANKAWTLSLRNRNAGSSEPYFGRGDTLDAAWGKVWGSFFGGMNEDKAHAASVVLSIDGWFTPDGVEAFDTMLQDWSDVLSFVSLQDVSMESAGISGHWAVNVIDADKLKARLTEYTSKRRLSFELKDI